MRTLLASAIVAAASCVGATMAVLLWLDSGNRYSWMRDFDAQTTSLPVDTQAPMRLGILLVGTLLCGAIAWLAARSIRLRWLRRAGQALAALLWAAAALRAWALL